VPKLSTAVTTTVTEQVKITPKQKVQLRKSLKLYAELHLAEKVAAQAKKKAVAEIRRIREEIGVEALEFEGYKATNVPNLRDFFDKQEFVNLGGVLEYYNNAIRKKPGTAYEKVSVPGAKSGPEDGQE
jgi:hypothetical protein